MKKHLLILLILAILVSCGGGSALANAKKMIKEKKYYEAINLLEGMEKKDGNVYFSLAEAYSGLRKFVVADSFFNMALEDKPGLKNDIVKAYASIAMTDFLKGYTFSAINYWQKILDINPGYDINIGFFYLGKYNYEQQNYTASKPMLMNALNISLPSADRIASYDMLIEIFKLEEKYDSSLLYATTALNEFQNPSNSDDDFSIDVGELTFLIAKEDYENKRYDEALNGVNVFISIAKPLSYMDDAYLIQGNIYFDLEDYEKAIAAYKKVIDLNDVKLYGSRNTYEEANDKLKEIVKRSMQ